MWAYAAAAVLLVRASVDSTPQALTAPGQAGTKVAVLLSGALRTLDWCTESLRTNLVEANPGMTFDFFAYLTADDGVDRGAMERSVDASLRNVSGTEPKVRVVTESEALAAVMQALMPSMQKLPAGRGTATGKGRNIIQMFYGIAGAATLLSETAGGDGPKSKLQTCDGADGGAEATAITAKYDLILRTRPDLCLCKPLDLHQVRLVAASPPPHAWRTALIPRAKMAGTRGQRQRGSRALVQLVGRALSSRLQLRLRPDSARSCCADDALRKRVRKRVRAGEGMPFHALGQRSRATL